jgi:hypothetical protein
MDLHPSFFGRFLLHDAAKAIFRQRCFEGMVGFASEDFGAADGIREREGERFLVLSYIVTVITFESDID